MELFKKDTIRPITLEEIYSSQLDNPSGNSIVSPIITGGIIYGAEFRSVSSGASFEILPSSDPTVGLRIKNSARTNVLLAEIDGTNTGDITIGNYSGGQGIKWDNSALTFSIAGAVTAGSISIGTSPNWFNVDTSGNIWSGADTLVNAKSTKFAVENTGALYASSATISGAITTSVGSDIKGTYIDALSVAKLSTGSITSKAITLAISGGTGDVKIQAGKTDFGDTTSGFIIGMDDSDSDKPKFEFGDATSYINYNGTSLYGNDIKLVGTFTAGETISSGNVVCIKPTYTDYVAEDDTYVDEHDHEDSFGTVEYVECVGRSVGGRYGYVKFDESLWPSADNILKAELILTVRGYTGDGGIAYLYEVQGAWSGSTTWDTKPTTESSAYPLLPSKYATEYKATYGTQAWETITWDITQLARKWVDGEVTNYGLWVFTNEIADIIFNFYSKENLTSDSYKPRVRIYTQNGSEEKIYKAANSNYLLCRSVVGVAQEAINSASTGKVQIAGLITNISTSSTGGKAYLSNTAGATTEALTGTGISRVISLGDIVSTNKILWNPTKLDILIEKPKCDTTLPLYLCNGSVARTLRLYVPNDARYCIVNIKQGTGLLSGIYDGVIMKINRDQTGFENMIDYGSVSTSGSVVSFTANWHVNGYIEISTNVGASEYVWIDYVAFYT